jgi:hypothetical protein
VLLQLAGEMGVLKPKKRHLSIYFLYERNRPETMIYKGEAGCSNRELNAHAHGMPLTEKLFLLEIIYN